MKKITIELDSSWARRARSPLYWAVVTFTPVAPMAVALLALGSGNESHFWLRGLVTAFCWAVFIVVYTFYVWLGQSVLPELRKLQDDSGSA